MNKNLRDANTEIPTRLDVSPGCESEKTEASSGLLTNCCRGCNWRLREGSWFQAKACFVDALAPPRPEISDDCIRQSNQGHAEFLGRGGARTGKRPAQVPNAHKPKPVAVLAYAQAANFGYLLAVAGILMGMLLPAPASAQIRLQAIRGGFAGAIDVNSLNSETADLEASAVLKTDPDLEATLATAQRMLNDGNYRVATQLYQAVLARSGDALYSDDGQIYFSLVRQVERILANLDPDALAAYRVTADAEAREILAQAGDPNDVTALNQVVGQYFISSEGDDAAFRLGCIYLDRFDFTGARRMFEKIVDHYPDTSVPLGQIWVRIALCESYLGNVEAAQTALASADQYRGASNQGSQIVNTLGQLSPQRPVSLATVDWSMLLGSSRGYGVMPSPPADWMESDLMANWQYFFEPKDKFKWSDAQGNVLAGEEAYRAADGTRSTAEKKIIQSWQKRGWRPAGHLCLYDDKVYFKSAADMTVWDREAVANEGAKKSTEATTTEGSIAWRSVWRNAFEVDTATQMLQLIRRNWGHRRDNNKQASDSSFPESTAEVQLFGDEVHQQMSIVNGVLYSLEGKQFDLKNIQPAQQMRPRWNASFRRTRTNFLTAYDAKTGEVQWTLPNQSGYATPTPAPASPAPASPGAAGAWIESGGFMSAPIGFGELLLVPINQGGSISIVALDPQQDGKTVWTSFLCDEPESGADPWSAIHLTLDGSDLFVSTGMGVVFVLDPATGTVRFAKRYQREGQPEEIRKRAGMKTNQLKFSGWSYDVVIPYGSQMICFSSDAQVILGLDRDSGKTVWSSDMVPDELRVDYLLGVHKDVLYAAGPETIIAYDLQADGAMLWGMEPAFGGKLSYGRGMLTPSGIYLPVDDSIYHFSLTGDGASPELLSRVQVYLGTEAPVGNLYSDGKRIWVHGANRLYALAPKK